MKLETKYGTLEGTVEEFRELLRTEIKEPTKENDDKGYKVVKEDTTCSRIGSKVLLKGQVLRHITRDLWEDTLGEQYIVPDYKLVDYNASWVEDKFNRYKDKGHLLLQIDSFKYKYKNFALTDLGKIVLKQVVVEGDDKDFSGRGTIQWVDTEGNTHKNFTHLELTDGFKRGLDNMFEDYKYKGKLLCREDVVGSEGEDYI